MIGNLFVRPIARLMRLLLWPKRAPRGRWQVNWNAEQNTAHVLPIDDLIDHEESDDCACRPTTEPVMRGDGSNGWLVTHHSLDGREQQEAR